MKLKRLSVIAIILSALTAVPAAAQSYDALEKKYGQRGAYFVRRNGFKVRPGIIMVASFTKENQMCEAVIEPERVTEDGVEHDKRMPAAVVEEILGEIIPAELRGRRTGGLIMGNYTSVSRQEYERVSITMTLVGVGGPEEKLTVADVRIRWKLRQCD